MPSGSIAQFINHSRGVSVFTINFRDYEIFNPVDLACFYIGNIGGSRKKYSLSLSYSLGNFFFLHMLKGFAGYFVIHAISRPEIPRSVISAVIVAVIRISTTKSVSGIFLRREW